jgi:hypothetical protein
MNEDDYPNIPNFNEQMAEFDELAKTMAPTRNKGNVTDFMVAVETLFRDKGWDFSAYCKKVAIDSYDRRQRQQGTKVIPKATQESENGLDNLK